MAEKIISRIDGVLKHIDYVQREMKSITFEEFKNRQLLPEAVCFNISQIGERMNKLEELIGDKYPDLPWKETRKMRNIIVHDYDGVDFEKVYITAMSDLPELKNKLLNVKNDINKTREFSLITQRLILRPWDDFDVDELFELAKEPEIGYWCGWEPHKHIRDSFFALHNFLEIEETYAVCLKDNQKLIGSISLFLQTPLASGKDECEIGFWIGKQYWNQGFATEAAKELINRAFYDLGLTKIWCGYYDGNERSQRLQKKLGFIYHHTSEDVDPQINTKRISHYSYLLKDNWKK